MSEPVSTATTPQASGQVQTPEQPIPTGGTQPEPQEERPLTAEDVRRIAREEVTPIAQSFADKSEGRINRRIQERFAALEETKSALNLSDDQVVEARQKIIVDEYSKREPETPASVKQPDADQIPAEVLAVLDPGIQWMRRQGVEIAESDPEYEKYLRPVLEKDDFNAADFSIAMSQAVTAYKGRKTLQRSNADARLPSGPVTTPGEASAGSTLQEWSNAYNRK